MALLYFDGVYEKLYKSDGGENEKYIDGYIEIKEKKKWIKYWCELKKKNLHFFNNVNTQIKEHYVGCFVLESGTNIESKRDNTKWKLVKENGKLNLKTDNLALKEQWIDAFQQSIRGKMPSRADNVLPGSGPARSPSRTYPRRPSSDYKLQEKELQDLRNFSRATSNNSSLSEDEKRVQQLLFDGEKRWYQPELRREDVERILPNERNGVFIVRDYYDSVKGIFMGYVISLKDHMGKIRHHKITKNSNQGLAISGYDGKTFNNLHHLLSFFIASQKKTIALIPFEPPKSGPAPAQRRAPPMKSSGRSQSLQDSLMHPPSNMNHRVSYDGGQLPRLPQIPDEDPQYLPMKGRPQARDEETEICYIDMKSPSCKDTTTTDYVISQSGTAPSNHSEYINVPTYSSDVQRDANSNVTSCDPEIHSDLLYIDIPPKLPPRSDSQESDNGGIGQPPKPPVRRAQTLPS